MAATRTDDTTIDGETLKGAFDGPQTGHEDGTERRNAAPRLVRNADNEYSMPYCGIGYVEEVNGPGAAEIQGFVPTRHELELLAKHYAKTAVDRDEFMYVYQQIGSDWLREMDYSYARLSRIDEILGGGIAGPLLETLRTKPAELRELRAAYDRAEQGLATESAPDRAD